MLQLARHLERSQLGKLQMWSIWLPSVICEIQGELNPVTRGCSAEESGGDVLCPIHHVDNLGGMNWKTEDEESQPVEQKRKR